MKNIDQTERLTRAVNFMQGVEAPAPLSPDGDKDARIAALEAKVNELVASIEQLSTGPDVDIQEGDELQPFIDEKQFIPGDGIQIQDLGDKVIIELEESVDEETLNDDPTIFPAKITAESSGVYSWTEQFLDSSGTWVDRTDGRSGTEAEEFNGLEDLYDPEETLIVPMHESYDGTKLQYRFNVSSADSGTCDSPLAMYSSFEGSTTAQSDTWDVENQGVNDGVKSYQHTRTAYAHDDANPILYGFYREYKYDSVGNLLAISGETRYTIDAPDLCDLVDGGSY